VFRCDRWYPCGGIGDAVGSADTIEDARMMGAKLTKDPDSWSHILDCETREVVK
jgi:hypothetical protein